MHIDIIDRTSGKPGQAAIEFDENGRAEVRLDLAPGATALQVILRDGKKVEAAIEVAAPQGETVQIQFLRNSEGVIRPVCDGLRFLSLPLEDDKPPKPLLFQPHQGPELDIAILVDATCMHPATTKQGEKLAYLLDPAMAEFWQKQIKLLATFAQAIAAPYSSVRLSTLAFGDEKMEEIVNSSLLARYLIFPAEEQDRIFDATTAAELGNAISRQLDRIEATSGGDFVDALADGINACRNLKWRQHARRLLLIFGQSPGYSLLNPLPEETNFISRKLCIEEESARLYGEQDRIEVVTVFHHPWDFRDNYRLEMPKLIEACRQQYATLASLSEWAIRSDSEDEVKRLAKSWLKPPVCLAQGACAGMLAQA